MNEWRECKLGNIADNQTGPFGSQLHQRDYVDIGTPCIMPTNIGSNLNIITDNIAHIKEEDVKRLSKYCVREGDIIYSRRGDIEKCAFIKKEEEGWLCGTGCLRIRINTEKAIPHFVAYQLSTKVCKRWVVNNAVGTTMPNLNTGILNDLPLMMPSMDTQAHIVSILKSLDDKIAINRRICENLEAQAQALFKHWFIDFAPFKDGQFVDSELGMIPEGWRVGTLGEIAEFKRGKTITKSETKDGPIPVVAGGLEPAYYHSQSNTSSRVITISGSGANAGFTRIYYQPVWASDCSFLDDSSTSLLHTAYCYLKTNKKKVDALQWGAAQPHVYAKDINKLPFVIAPLEILNQFELLISEMFDCIEVYDKENLRLAQLRDTLLPKLMSGQIKV